MKKLYFLLLAVALHTHLAAEDLSRKFGRVTDYEIDMTTYAADTTASAVYLYEQTGIRFDLNSSSTGPLFRQSRDYAVKIKILRPEGVSLADVEIPYRMSTKAGWLCRVFASRPGIVSAVRSQRAA